MKRTEVINRIIENKGYTSYLEIGVLNSENLGGVNAKVKHGVDPNVDTTYRMPSDEFFENHIPQTYDIVFVDGLHHAEQAYRDIINSLANLNDGGTIVVHDCNPIDERHQLRESLGGAWNGDVWKAILQLKTERTDLSIMTVDTDHGCAIIKVGQQELLKLPEGIDPYTYDYLQNNRKEVLNLVTIEDFLQTLK